MNPLSPNPRRWSAGLILVLLAAAGCTGQPNQCTVSGRVLYGTEPLRSGTVVFLLADGTKKGTPIGSDGRYRMTGIDAGPVQIGILNHARVPPGLSARGGPGAKAGGDEEPRVQIPADYNSPESSGLRYTVISGSHEHNIEIPAKPSGR
jgi:hypothetical protein